MSRASRSSLLFFGSMLLVAATAGAAPKKPPKPPPEPPPAPAPPSADDEARVAIKRGIAAFARHEPEAALAEFKRASELVPDANQPHRYAAEALVELERYEEAIDEYQRYLAIKPDVSDADDIKKRIEETRAKLTGSVTITSSPAGASVFVDNASAPAGTTPLAGLKLSRGPHTLTVRLAGKKDVVLSPVVRGGTNVALACDFTELGPGSKAPAAPAPPPPRGKSPVGWIVLGAGAAIGLGTFAADAFVLKPKVDDFDAQRTAGDPAARDTQTSIATTKTILLVGYGVSIVTMIVGTTILLWPSKSTTAIAPNVGPTHGGLEITGRFGLF